MVHSLLSRSNMKLYVLALLLRFVLRKVDSLSYRAPGNSAHVRRSPGLNWELVPFDFVVDGFDNSAAAGSLPARK